MAQASRRPKLAGGRLWAKIGPAQEGSLLARPISQALLLLLLYSGVSVGDFMGEDEEPENRKGESRAAMGSLENLVTQIQGLSGSVEDIAHLHTILKQADDSLQLESTLLNSLLDQVDPAKHSLGYLYIL